MEIGKQLKEARIKSHLTQEMMSEKINVSRQTISNLEFRGLQIQFCIRQNPLNRQWCLTIWQVLVMIILRRLIVI